MFCCFRSGEVSVESDTHRFRSYKFLFRQCKGDGIRGEDGQAITNKNTGGQDSNILANEFYSVVLWSVQLYTIGLQILNL